MSGNPTKAMGTIWRRLMAVLLAGLYLASPLCHGATLLDVHGEFTAGDQSQVKRFTIPARETSLKLGICLQSNLKVGTVRLQIVGPDGNPVLEQTFGEGRHFSAKTLEPSAGPAALQVELGGDSAAGEWELVAVEIPTRSALYPAFATGPLMMLVAAAFVIGWRMRSRVQWRWFWAGAVIWTVGVGAKLGWAILTNPAILGGLESAFPRALYLAAGSAYIGALTGIFEIGVTLACAMIWRHMALRGDRAVAVGVGAGACEALLLGAAALTQAFVMVSGMPQADLLLVNSVYLASSTSLSWLVSPVERIIAILCHTSSRTLVLLCVAKRQWSLFWYGFALISAIDALAGFLHLGGYLGSTSLWWVEWLLAPFAIASFPIVKWCLRRWPSTNLDRPTADSAGTEGEGTCPSM